MHTMVMYQMQADGTDGNPEGEMNKLNALFRSRITRLDVFFGIHIKILK